MEMELGDLTGKATIDDEELIDYIKRNYNPEDVFDKDDLIDWALSHGFRREE